MRNLFCLTVMLSAACSPAEQQTAAPAAPDTTAVRAGLEALFDRYDQAVIAGDAAGVGPLYRDDATIVVYGIPELRGRAAIEAWYVAALSMLKVPTHDIVLSTVNAPAPGLTTALGTYSETVDSAGTIKDSWGRWVGSFVQDSTGEWRIAFLMAFPDSVKAAQ